MEIFNVCKIPIANVAVLPVPTLEIETDFEERELVGQVVRGMIHQKMSASKDGIYMWSSFQRHDL